MQYSWLRLWWMVMGDNHNNNEYCFLKLKPHSCGSRDTVVGPQTHASHVNEITKINFNGKTCANGRFNDSQTVCLFSFPLSGRNGVGESSS